MTKILIVVLTSLVILSGVTGVTIAAAHEVQPGEPSLALHYRSRQTLQLHAEAQVQEKLLVQQQSGQAETGNGEQAQDRIRLETMEMLHDQSCLRDQDQIRLSQGSGNQPEPARKGGKP